jgi:CTP:molybdopterin cytidylyltransferase MocA
MSIMTVVLAAGASSRMGTPKALVDLDGATFATRINNAARSGGVGGVLFVVGPPDGDRVKAKLPPGAAAVWNPDPSRGMLSSVQTAVQAAVPRGTTAILVWPVDQPSVRAETVRQILDAAPGKIIVPRHAGKGGHPVRIPAKFFPQLVALPVDAGLHGLLDAQRESVVYLDVDDPGVTRDFDTPEEVAQAKSEKHSTKKAK